MEKEKALSEQKRREKNARKSMQKNTLLLALLLVLGFGGGLFWMNRLQKETGGYVVIEQYGVRLKRLPLAKEAALEVPAEDGGYNLVEIKGGTVRVKEADCPNQTCVKTGAIRYPGEVISCIPHRLIVTIE